jgi:hypothetical protein
MLRSMSNVSACSSSADSTCKWCKRDRFLTPNPLVSDPQPGDMLPWRRKQGRECSVCPAAITADEELSAMTRDALMASLADEAEFGKYKVKIEKYEELRRNGKRADKRHCSKSVEGHSA